LGGWSTTIIELRRFHAESFQMMLTSAYLTAHFDIVLASSSKRRPAVDINHFDFGTLPPSESVSEPVFTSCESHQVLQPSERQLSVCTALQGYVYLLSRLLLANCGVAVVHLVSERCNQCLYLPAGDIHTVGIE
tara:strand:- start:3387 stop:3788 length:402 start_codon:yes stop_codon:yes gene_type:complete